MGTNDEQLRILGSVGKCPNWAVASNNLLDLHVGVLILITADPFGEQPLLVFFNLFPLLLGRIQPGEGSLNLHINPGVNCT